jgi:hypothetical protein
MTTQYNCTRLERLLKRLVEVYDVRRLCLCITPVYAYNPDGWLAHVQIISTFPVDTSHLHHICKELGIALVYEVLDTTITPGLWVHEYARLMRIYY